MSLFYDLVWAVEGCESFRRDLSGKIEMEELVIFGNVFEDFLGFVGVEVKGDILGILVGVIGYKLKVIFGKKR